MSLSSSQLEAFGAVAKTGNFSKAAKTLHITQSALSQRILNLENELHTALIIRDPSGLRLTSAGQELLRYCQIKDNLETEVLNKISSSHTEKSGVIRIAGFSSVIRSVILPSISNLMTSSQDIHVELFVREIRDLPQMLTNNEADFIVTSQPPFRQEIMDHDLGVEENVLVTGKEDLRPNIFLDHDPDDQTTSDFFHLNPKLKKDYRRDYLDEVYAIVDGVKAGWGRAILPKHLVGKDKALHLVKGAKPLQVPVRLQYFRQPYYSKLHESVVEAVCKKAPRFLKG